MQRGKHSPPAGQYLIGVLAGVLLSLGATAYAQDSVGAANNDGYEVSDSAAQNANDSPANANAATPSAGPVRLLRFTLVQGDVTWRADSSLEWAKASINLPLRQGAQVFVPTQGRAELQFDDGSLLRLGAGALVTFQNLYSDADGEFTELKLNDGLASLHLKNKLSIYQVDTPHASVKAVGPARFRVGVRDTVELAVKSGSATVEGQQGKTNVNAGEFLEMRDATSPFAIAALPTDDNWEQWNDERDRIYDDGSPAAQQHLPPNLYLVAPDLDTYGSWQTVPTYGAVWCPRVSSDWRPYRAGHWVWVNPFGWTWVSSEAWGWAPYHYGTWAHTVFGWAWVPGPSHQYWSPAVVNFCSTEGSIAWTPLCPEEVRYPVTLGLGFRRGDWSLFFSIGGCGVYYPGVNHVCEARPWNTVYVNRVTYVTNVGGEHTFYAANHNTWVHGPWVPRNAHFGGATMVSSGGFVSGGIYAPVPRGNLAVFQQGRPIGAPPAGRIPAAGPANIRPTLAALTPTRTFVQTAPPATIANRQLYHMPVSPQFAHNAPGIRSRIPTPTTNPTLNQANRVPTVNPRPLGEGGIRSTGPRTIPGAGTITGAPSPAVTTHPTLERMPTPRTGPGTPEDAVIRARASLGLPARARRSDGTVVGSGTAFPGSSGARTSNQNSPGTRIGGDRNSSGDRPSDRSNTPAPRIGTSGTQGNATNNRGNFPTPSAGSSTPYRNSRPSYGVRESNRPSGNASRRPNGSTGQSSGHASGGSHDTGKSSSGSRNHP